MLVRFFYKVFHKVFSRLHFQSRGPGTHHCLSWPTKTRHYGGENVPAIFLVMGRGKPKNHLAVFQSNVKQLVVNLMSAFFTCTVFAIWLSQQFCTFLPHWLWQQHWRWYLHDTSLHWPTPVKCNWVVFARKMVPQQNSQWQFWASVWTCCLWHACRKVYQLGTFHRARPDVPMRAINNIAGCLGLTQHDDQWCLGPGMPVAEIPCGVSSSRWCLSGWILSREDQDPFQRRPREIQVSICQKGDDQNRFSFRLHAWAAQWSNEDHFWMDVLSSHQVSTS